MHSKARNRGRCCMSVEAIDKALYMRYIWNVSANTIHERDVNDKII